MTSPIRTELKVTDNVPFGQSGQRSFYALSLERPSWADWLPGQFVMIRPNNWGAEMTWARPLSICRVTQNSLVLFFQAVGRGTTRMAQLCAGDTVTVWGPLGTGFAVEPVDTLLLAGGIGIAPFAGYIDRHPDSSRLSMLFGHRMPAGNYPSETLSQRIELDHFYEESPADLAIFQDKIRHKMDECKRSNGLALACGPMPFLHLIWKYAAKIDLRVQLSMEQRMACGVGACLGCVTVTSQHWADADKAGLPVQTCTCGPVFWGADVNLDANIAEMGK